jgi:molecular chaperone GrpE
MSDEILKDWKKIKENQQALDDEEGGSESGGFSEQTNDDLVQEQGALDHPSYQALEEKLTLAEQKAHDHWEKLVRSVAEVDNIRRRAERDVSNAHRYALEKFVSTLLPVADSLEQAIVLAERQGDIPLHEGLLLTMKLLVETLEKADVKQIDPTGMPFDPQLHEAMSIQPSPDVSPNTVVMVFQKGYLLNDRVIRPARVIVSK